MFSSLFYEYEIHKKNGKFREKGFNNEIYINIHLN